VNPLSRAIEERGDRFGGPDPSGARVELAQDIHRSPRTSSAKRSRPHQGCLKTAIECLRKALRVAPDYADAMFNLALLLQRKNQYAEAADYWRRYLASNCQSEWATRARRSGRAPAERSGLFCRARLFHWKADVVPLCCRILPRRGVGCCVPLLTHLPSYVHSVSLGQSGFLAPAPPSRPGLFLAAADPTEAALSC
jgi:hypothetical protein